MTLSDQPLQGAVTIGQFAEHLAGLPERSIVAIDGCGAAGKSTFANAIRGRTPCVVVHTDDFASHAEPMMWWPRMVTQVLDPWSNELAVEYRPYDWSKRELGSAVHLPNDSPLLIVEGVGSSRREFEPFIELSIWLEVPEAECLRRGLARDVHNVAEYGGFDALEAFWDEWQANERQYVTEHDPKGRARFVLDGTRGTPGETVWIL